jgi:CubicO group peptidase (beta-lactamase class C family)
LTTAGRFTRRDFGKLMGVAGAAVAAPVLAAGTPAGAQTLSAARALAAARSARSARAAGAAAVTRSWRVTGTSATSLNGFDAAIKSFMQARDIPSASLAVTRKGKLIAARGYTWAAGTAAATAPTSLFRIASLTKPITATAVLRLVQDGRLKLTDRVTDLLDLAPAAAKLADPRLPEITVLRLLQHLGGWDQAITQDPMFSDFRIAGQLGVALPVRQADIIRYNSGLPLDHAPGTTYAYANYGYLLLGRIIEKVSGLGYPAYVQQKVLTPAKIKRMKQGKALVKAAGEVPFYSQYTGTTVYDASAARVASPYGSFNLENMDSHGGWLASAVDLTRFAQIYDGSFSVLNSTSISHAFAKPEIGINSDGWYYGCGWQVRPVTGGRNTWHNGSLPGTYSLLVRRFDGIGWAVLFDQRDDPSAKSYDDIDPLLEDTANKVKTWPTKDLSGTYF